MQSFVISLVKTLLRAIFTCSVLIYSVLQLIKVYCFQVIIFIEITFQIESYLF